MSDPIKKVELLRNLYRAQNSGGNNEILRELKQVNNELKIANDIRVRTEKAITNATGSPYLEDQTFQQAEVRYNSPRETEWKEVKSYEENRQNALVFRNLKRLNII